MKRNQTVSALQKIADAIGCKISDFFYEEDENLEADDSNIEKKIVCPNCGKQFFME
jgi:hypothetical protein